MKKLFLALTIIAAVTDGFAQGTVLFFNNVGSFVNTRVYMPETGTNVQIAKLGNTPTDSPPGTQSYTGTLVTGSGWTAQIWSAPGSNQPESALSGYTTTTFRTGTAAGVFAGFITATLGNVPLDAPAATLQIRVFPTELGSWALVEQIYHVFPGFRIYDYPLGKSELFTVYNIGGIINPPSNLVGLTSFNLYTVTPEPSATALTGMGAAAMLLRRRRTRR